MVINHMCQRKDIICVKDNLVDYLVSLRGSIYNTVKNVPR